MSDSTAAYKVDRVSSADGRSRESRLLRRVRADLVRHCGGNPSPTQLALIERAAMLSLHVARLDEQALAGAMTEQDSRQYLAWNNALSRTLKSLGLHSFSHKPRMIA